MENSGQINEKRLKIKFLWKKHKVQTAFLKYKRTNNFLLLWIVSEHSARLEE